MIYLFNNKEELLHIIPTKDIHEAIQDLGINKVISIECKLKCNKYDVINQAEYMGHYFDSNFYMYRIIRNELPSDGLYEFSGVHVIFEELKAYGYIRDMRPNNVPVGAALTRLLEGSRWRIGKLNSEAKGSTSWYDLSRFDALKDLIDKWGVELDYRIEFDGVRIINRFIDVYDKMGVDTGKRFVYGSNALSIKSETSKSAVYTSLIGRGKGEEKFDEHGQSTGGYGRRIQFTDVEWLKTKGDPVDKPKGQEFVTLDDATSIYGFSDGEARTKVAIFEDCADPKELLKLTYDMLVNISRPQVTFTAEVANIGKVNLGDGVRIIRRELGIFYTARVFAIKRNLLDDRLTQVELGDYIPSNGEKSRNEIKSRLDGAREAINDVRKDSVGKINKLLGDLKEGINLQYFNDESYSYELQAGNKWELPAGYYSFDKPIDNNPTKVIYIGAGKIMISDRKDSTGAWQWSVFGTGSGFTADLINAGVINGNLIKSGSIVTRHLDSGAITTSKIAANAVTGDKIKARSITADEIDVGTITAREIKSATITNGEIAGHTITGDEVRSKTLDSGHIREIKVDILRPGNSNRIIFEGDYPGDNNVKSLDATGSAIRLKYNSSNYVYVGDYGIDFYSSEGKVKIRGSNVVADNIGTTSDVRAKENIKYLGHKMKIKPNEAVNVPDIINDDIISFIKNINFATYNYQFSSTPQMGVIAQNVEKYDKIAPYVVFEDEGRKYVNTNTLNIMSLVTCKELIKEVESLREEVKILKKDGGVDAR